MNGTFGNPYKIKNGQIKEFDDENFNNFYSFKMNSPGEILTSGLTNTGYEPLMTIYDPEFNIFYNGFIGDTVMLNKSGTYIIQVYDGLESGGTFSITSKQMSGSISNKPDKLKEIDSSGDNTYNVSKASDKVNEIENGGIDTVNSKISYTLGDYVENLTLKTSTKINGTGNELDNTIIGNNGINTLSGLDGNDTLIGGLGKDTLTGGLGEDKFVLNTKPSKNNVDTITDFTALEDTIQLDNKIFKKLQDGNLNLDNFVSNSNGKALDLDDYIVYDNSNGKLYYDKDGSGKAKAVEIAIIGNNTDLTVDDFLII